MMVTDSARETSTKEETPRPSSDGASFMKQTANGIILNPQPHDNPNDPLNWPIWRRDVALLIVSIYALLSGGMTPILAPVMSTLEHEFNKPLHSLTYLVGVLMVSMGVGSALLAPIAVKYGKRLVYLIALLIFLGGLIWGANADSYGSLMGARVISGIGASPAESLPSTTIAEIYFAHERAYRLGIYTLLLLGGKNLSPLASAFTANRLGWHWIFWVSAIICAGAFAGTLLFVHETWWDRAPTPDKRSVEESEAAAQVRRRLHMPPYESGVHRSRSDTQPELHHAGPDTQPELVEVYLGDERAQGNSAIGELSVDCKSIDSGSNINTATTNDTTNDATNANVENTNEADQQIPESSPADARNDGDAPRVPFFRNLGIYSGAKTNDPLWAIFVRPFVLYTYIPILFSTLIYSTSVVWLSVIAETINTIFGAAPYHFKSTSIGLLYIATFIGGVLGSVVAGKGSDIIVRVMCRHNKGVYEPEFRLVMILPVMFTSAIGLMGFGWSSFKEDLWIVPAVFLGILGFGVSLASTVSITYTVDCYRKVAPEALVSLNIFKNVLGLVFSIFVPYFFESSGAKTSYVVYGCVEIGLCLLVFPLYRYGKVIRNFHDRHDIIQHFFRG